MSIIPVSAASAALWPATETPRWASTQPTSPTSPTAPLGGADGAGSAGGAGDSFANILGNAIDSVQSAQANADNLATQAATGSLTNVVRLHGGGRRGEHPDPAHGGGAQ